MTTIEAELRDTNVAMRFPCHICGGETDKERVLVSFMAQFGERFVCSSCVQVGPEGVRYRLAKQAERLREHAEYLEELAGAEWSVPTYEQWKAANCASERVGDADEPS